MEAQGYDAAIVFGVCDKMLVGNLRALVETDLARQRRRARPVFAMVIPSLDQQGSLRHGRRAPPVRAAARSTRANPSAGDLDELLQRPLKPNVYAGLKCLLDRWFHQRLIRKAKRTILNT